MKLRSFGRARRVKFNKQINVEMAELTAAIVHTQDKLIKLEERVAELEGKPLLGSRY